MGEPDQQEGDTDHEEEDQKRQGGKVGRRPYQTSLTAVVSENPVADSSATAR